jgi:hypothetical protein
MSRPTEQPRPVPRAGRGPALRITGWTIAWTIWIAFFLVIETAALIRKKPGDTFSEHWWSAFRVRSKVPLPVRVVLLIVQLVFGTWLVGHLAFGIWTL